MGGEKTPVWVVKNRERERTGAGGKANIQVRQRPYPLRRKGLSPCGYNPLSRHLQLEGRGERLRLSVGPVV